MTYAIRHRIVTVALAALAGLVVAASPAAATDDPAPRPAPQGGAPSAGAPAPAGGQAPAVSPRHKRAVERRVRVRVRYRKHRKGVRVSLAGPGMTGVKRVDVFVHGRRIASDATRPFRVVIGGRRLGGGRKLQIRLVQQAGVRTLTQRLRSNGSAKRSAIAASVSLKAMLKRYGVI